MPTYAYACKQCGHRFDAVQSFSDAALTECPECGGVLRKQFGTVGVTFNGSGFYRTDSRSTGSPAAGSASAGSSTSSKSEAKASPASSGS
ncbi:FmdB family zinc ribbon protein [Microbacterium telephonicum]|uniref:Putative FmdB family regulatory protein n=1 Tax=Microbacterium telephonicum TaxID=1714841 RepID=A0A498C385_9MICO|nr:FmdB family zinc ribbon protein [Microbacterium telephonicum]RLK47348.1 putative FmdB family regulatory protein [Microbacterium telephonicum]